MTRDKNRELDFHASLGFTIGETRVFGRLYGVSGKALKEVRNHEDLRSLLEATSNIFFRLRVLKVKDEGFCGEL